MQDPSLLQKEAADDLKGVLDEYPFSGVLHALYAKALKNQGNYLYPKQLKRTAITVPDRKVLHAWTEQPIKVAREEQKPALDFAARTKKVEEPKPVEKPIESIQVEEKQPEVVASKKVEPKPEAEPIPKPRPVKPKVAEAPKVAAKIERTKETDLDLSNLPASVRETVLRARKLRQRYGQEEETKVPPGPIPPVVVNKPKPVEQEPVAEEKEAKPQEPAQSVEKPAPVKEQLYEESVTVEQPPTETSKIEQPDFELAADEPIEEEKLAPIESEVNERHSFLDWLETSHDDESPLTTPVKRDAEESEDLAELTFEPDFGEEEKEQEKTEKASTERMQELYASFMDKPKIDFRAPSKEPEITAAGLGTSGHSDYITETLAQVYVNQKLYNRAINAYEILSLKYPEKSSFFAAQILEIKELLNEKKR